MGKTTKGTAIVFYSRSGHSKRLAQRLNDKLHGDLLEIRAPSYEAQFVGYARAGYDSLRLRDMPIAQAMPSVADFDRVILCGPIWTSYPAVPVRSLLRSGLSASQTIGLFLTSGGQSPAHKAFAAAQVDLGRPLAAMYLLPNAAEDTDEEDRILAAFLADLEGVATLAARN